LEESLRRDIEIIRAKVLEMGHLGERALKASLQSLVERNRQLAYSVILRDQYLDELETELDRLCLEFLVRQQPVASHLRFVFTAIKINKELERIGDYAESVARQVLTISSLEPQPPHAKFVELGHLAIHMLRDAVQSFLDQDADLARRTMVIEERANGLRSAIGAELMALRQAEELPLAALTPLLTIARRFERVTDQAKNLCEEVLYMCTGEVIKHKGGEAFRILFIDEGNGCLSQMAEGIGQALGIRRFVFSSAGLTPEPVDERVVAFLASKGMSLGRQASKSLEQVPHLEHYQVMVALTETARKAFPPPPTKTVCLVWPVADPLAPAVAGEDVQAGLEAAFRYLNTHIRELVEAILGNKPQEHTS